MSARVAAPEETRDLLRAAPASVAALARFLHVSESTVRRHLSELRERGQVVPSNRGVWHLTASGRSASEANEAL